MTSPLTQRQLTKTIKTSSINTLFFKMADYIYEVSRDDKITGEAVISLEAGSTFYHQKNYATFICTYKGFSQFLTNYPQLSLADMPARSVKAKESTLTIAWEYSIESESAAESEQTIPMDPLTPKLSTHNPTKSKTQKKEQHMTKKGMITKLAGILDSILPSNDKPAQKNYGNWQDTVNVIKGTIDGVNEMDQQFLDDKKTTIITKFIFYPQDKISKNHLQEVLSTYPNDSQDDSIYDGNEFREFIQQVIEDFGYARLKISPKMVIEVNDNELQGDGSIDEIINAGWLEYTHESDAGTGQTGQGSYDHKVNPINEEGNKDSLTDIDSSSEPTTYDSDTVAKQAQCQDKNLMGESTLNSLNLESPNEVTLKCECYDANGTKNITIDRFPCKIGKASTGNDIIINGFYVSGEHLTLDHKDGDFYLQDHSSNKTFVANRTQDSTETLHGSVTKLGTGHNIVLLGGQSQDFAKTPKLVIQIDAPVVITGTVTPLNPEVFAPRTPLNTESDPELTLDTDHSNDDTISPFAEKTAIVVEEFVENTTNNDANDNTENLDDAMNIMTPVELPSFDVPVTKLAPLFKLLVTDCEGEQRYEVPHIPWTLGRGNDVNTFITVQDINNSTVSRKHVTFIDYDDLEELLEIEVIGANGIFVDGTKYSQGDTLTITPNQVVKIGLEESPVLFHIFIDDYCR